MSINYPSTYFEPQEFRGQWQTHCQKCEWKDATIHQYPDECDEYECPECGTSDIVDINLETEE